MSRSTRAPSADAPGNHSRSSQNTAVRRSSVINRSYRMPFISYPSADENDTFYRRRTNDLRFSFVLGRSSFVGGRVFNLACVPAIRTP